MNNNIIQRAIIQFLRNLTPQQMRQFEDLARKQGATDQQICDGKQWIENMKNWR